MSRISLASLLFESSVREGKRKKILLHSALSDRLLPFTSAPQISPLLNSRSSTFHLKNVMFEAGFKAVFLNTYKNMPNQQRNLKAHVTQNEIFCLRLFIAATTMNKQCTPKAWRWCAQYLFSLRRSTYDCALVIPLIFIRGIKSSEKDYCHCITAACNPQLRLAY